jgi:hypothetical protein
VRSRVTAAVVAMAVAASWVLSPSAGAQVPPDGPPTSGRLLDGGAEVTAGKHDFNPSEGNVESAPRGMNGSRECWYSFSDPVTGTSVNHATQSDLQTALAGRQAAGLDKVPVVYHCQDEGTGANPIDTSTDWPPDGNTGFVVSPEALAQQAKNRLWYPPPNGSTSPGLATGTFAQLPTYYWLTNIEPGPSARAEAGGVWAEATAAAVGQHWTVNDTQRHTTYEFDCDGPGVPYDPSTGDPPPPGVCQPWSPPHSSAGHQPWPERGVDQPCFRAVVVVTWHITWNTNQGPGGDLGFDTSESSTCVVVQEIQAVVTPDG